MSYQVGKQTPEITSRGEVGERKWVCEKRCGYSVTALLNPVECKCGAELVRAPTR